MDSDAKLAHLVQKLYAEFSKSCKNLSKSAHNVLQMRFLAAKYAFVNVTAFFNFQTTYISGTV